MPVPGEVDEEEINEGITTVNAITDLTNLYNKHVLEYGSAKFPHMYGDLLLTPEQEKEMIGGRNGAAQGFLYTATRWPNGVVPFQLDARLSKLSFN